MGATPPSFGYRYYQQFLILEYRMNNLAPDEETTLINVYLSNLSSLEAAILTASSNLDTLRAAVWWHNPNEIQDRYGLYNLWQKKLIEFMGVTPIGPLTSRLSFVI